MEAWEKRQYMKDAIRNGIHIAVIGPHGIGKTEAIRQWVKEEMPEFKCIYTSLAGMAKEDFATPYPVEIDGERYVRYLLHEIMDDRTPEGRKPIVLILDEFNRNVTDQQIYNALLEVMSIGTMLGRKVNLHSIVALMNPDTDSRYTNTTELEITVLDRFGLYFYVDGYDMGADDYLLRHYPQTAPAVIEWYGSLPDEKRRLVPPRRQEYILKAYHLGFPLELAIPSDVQVPISALSDMLNNGKIWTLNRLLNDPVAAAESVSKQPSLVPLFFALLRSVRSTEQAARLMPVVSALPTHVRLALVKLPNSIWIRVVKETKAGDRQS